MQSDMITKFLHCMGKAPMHKYLLVLGWQLFRCFYATKNDKRAINVLLERFEKSVTASKGLMEFIVDSTLPSLSKYCENTSLKISSSGLSIFLKKVKLV